jgi:hypothetical protein
VGGTRRCQRATLLVLALAILVPPTATAQTATAGSATEPLTLEAFQKLKDITQGAKAADLDAPVVKTLGIGAGGTISAKQFKAETAIGLYVFTIPVKPATDDVVFSFRNPAGVTYNYLSDSSRKLRSAMVTDAEGSRTIPAEQAEAGFQDSLRAWGIIARRVKTP